MMDWTDRHCRYFHRLITRRTRLYTEMVTTGALLGSGLVVSSQAYAVRSPDPVHDEHNCIPACPASEAVGYLLNQRGEFGSLVSCSQAVR